MANTVEQQLRRARKARGLTQRQLAERAGVSRFVVSRTETRGDDTRLSTLEAMAEALELELLLVPRALRAEIEHMVRAGGRTLAQPAGIEAPRSVVDQ